MINFIDILLPILLIISAYLGRYRGTVKQASSLAGILLGLVIAALLYGLLVHLTESSLMRALVLTLIIVAITFLSYDLFAVFGRRLQERPFLQRFTHTKYDKIASAALTGVMVFVVFWMAVLLFGSVLPSSARALLKDSRILYVANEYLHPPAFIGNIGQLLRPFSSPDVFATDEPSFNANSLPVAERYGELDKAIARVETSVSRIKTWGCGSIGTGSGFIIGKNLIMTNAHVIAGADRISVENNGVAYMAKAVLFDPRLDVAVLLTESQLTGDALAVTSGNLSAGAIAAVLGYPGGGTLTSEDVVVLQSIQARGYDIYQADKVERQIYVVRSSIVPGDSGAPLIDAAGQLAGMVIGHSTADGRIGFAINASQLQPTIKKAHNLRDVVNTGLCAGSN